jgi:hypothetical protein
MHFDAGCHAFAAIQRPRRGVAKLARQRPRQPIAGGHPFYRRVGHGKLRCTAPVSGYFTADDLVFAKQSGVAYVTIPTRGGIKETFARYKQRAGSLIPVGRFAL